MAKGFYEAEHASHTGEYAVNQETVNGFIHPSAQERSVTKRGYGINSFLQKPLQPRADQAERQIKYHSHNQDEARQSRELAGQNFVNLTAPEMLSRLGRLLHRGRTDAVDKPETHVRHGRAAGAQHRAESSSFHSITSLDFSIDSADCRYNLLC